MPTAYPMRHLVAAMALSIAAQVHAAPVDLDLPAQPLALSLRQLGEAAGLTIAVDSSLTSGRTAPALRGQLEPLAALGHLLAGSGLRYQQSGNTLVISQPSDAVELGATNISGRALGTSTEGTGSYTTGRLTLGKGEQSLRETPQSVSVVTRQRMDDQNLTTLGEAMRYTTGMKTTSYGTGTDNIEARGYDLDSYQLDGVPVRAGQGSWSSGFLDLAIFDRIEVWRGPAGLLQGAGEPGGTVNLARKRALGEFALGGSLSAGSWDRYRGEVDVTGPLSEDGRLRGRFVNAYEDSQAFTDYVWWRKNVSYGTLEFDLDDSTTLSAMLVRQDGKSNPFYGLSSYVDGTLARLDRDTFIGADWNNKTEHLTFYLTELDHRLANGGQAKLTVSLLDRESDGENNGWSSSFIDPASGEVRMVPIAIRSDERDINLDGFVSTPFEALGREHNLLLGASWQRYSGGSAYNRSTYGMFATNQNIFDPDVHIPKPDLPLGEVPDVEQSQASVYGQLRYRLLDPLTLVLGARVSDWRTEDHDAHSEQTESGQVVPYGGLIYDLDEHLSLYASYSTIYLPQTARDHDDRFLEPREGQQYEIGIKGEYFDGRLNSHFALFRIRDKNQAMQDPDDPFASIAAGEVESEGLEAEISGSLTERWELTTGYAYTRTEYIEADDALKGQPYSTGFPRHNFNLWTKYRFGDGWLDGASLGGGLKRVSESSYEVGSLRWKQPGYTLASLQLGYRLNRHLDGTLTVNNLFDKYYYDRIGPTRQTYLGEPRSTTLTLRWKL